MRARKQRVVLHWTGLLLNITGFLSFVGSFFLLPLYVTTLNCIDSCTPPKRATAWEFSLNLLTSLRMALEISPLLLVLLYLPLLMAAVAVGCGIVMLVHPQRTFAIWGHRAWLTGIIALLLLLPLLLAGLRPETGYLGMLAGYALFWGGNRVFLAARPKAHAAS